MIDSKCNSFPQKTRVNLNKGSIITARTGCLACSQSASWPTRSAAPSSPNSTTQNQFLAPAQRGTMEGRVASFQVKYVLTSWGQSVASCRREALLPGDGAVFQTTNPGLLFHLFFLKHHLFLHIVAFFKQYFTSTTGCLATRSSCTPASLSFLSPGTHYFKSKPSLS